MVGARESVGCLGMRVCWVRRVLFLNKTLQSGACVGTGGREGKGRIVMLLSNSRLKDV